MALAGVAGLATAVFRPAVFAGLPNLVEDRELPNANSLLQGIENLTWMAGPLAGGALVAARGPHLAYWVNAGTFLLSAALIARIPGRLLQAAAAVSRGHWRDLSEGFALARRSRSLATVLIAWSVAVFVAAGINVADVALAKRSFHAGDFGFGLLVGSTGLGLVLGSFLAAGWIRRSGMAPVYGASIGLMAAGFGGAAVSPNVWVAAACIVVAGAGNGAAVVCNALLVQRGAPDRVRGRAFTVVMSANFLMLALGMAAAGPLVDSVGARWVFGGAGALAGVAAAIGFFLARGAPEADDGEAEPMPLLAYPPAPGRSTSLD